LSAGAFWVVQTLQKNGFEALFAGGAVRDALLKRPIKEIDIATNARPQAVQKIFARTIPTGLKHGTVTVREGGESYEVTTFRVEGPYRDYRRPSKVTFVRSAAEDAVRRDFGINALFYDVAKRAVVDYVGGIADLSHRQVAFVGDSQSRIREDALRMLRAVRFVTTLNFELAREARKAIEKNAKLIRKISSERIKQELDRIIASERVSVGFGTLDVVGLTEHILPELHELQGVTQPRNLHSEGDVYAHTLLALEKMDEGFDLPTRYAVLFHDMGKKKTRAVRDGRVTFYSHQTESAAIAKKICERLKFSRQETDKIIWLVKNHMVPFDVAEMKLSTKRKWALHPYFADLLKLYAADNAASLRPSGKPNREPPGYREWQRVLRNLARQPEMKKPLLTGDEVMKILKLKPGPDVGKVLKFLEEKKLAGKIKDKKAALEFLKQKGTSVLN